MGGSQAVHRPAAGRPVHGVGEYQGTPAAFGREGIPPGPAASEALGMEARRDGQATYVGREVVMRYREEET